MSNTGGEAAGSGGSHSPGRKALASFPSRAPCPPGGREPVGGLSGRRPGRLGLRTGRVEQHRPGHLLPRPAYGWGRLLWPDGRAEGQLQLGRPARPPPPAAPAAPPLSAVPGWAAGAGGRLCGASLGRYTKQGIIVVQKMDLEIRQIWIENQLLYLPNASYYNYRWVLVSSSEKDHQICLLEFFLKGKKITYFWI